MTTDAGTEVAVHCNDADSSQTAVIWQILRPGETESVDLDLDDRIKKAGHRLTISDVRVTDSGVYECRAVDKETDDVTKRFTTVVVRGESLSHFGFLLKGKPQVDVTTVVAELFACAQISYRDKEGVPPGRTVLDCAACTGKTAFRVAKRQKFHMLLFVFFHAYQLLMFAIAGPPIITKVVVTAVQEEHIDQAIILSVSIVGNPPPEISWFREDNSSVTIDARVTLLANGSLRICHVVPSDIGVYTVTARNSFGQASKGVECCSKL